MEEQIKLLDFEQNLLKFCKDSGLPKSEIISALDTTKFLILYMDAEEAKDLVTKGGF